MKISSTDLKDLRILLGFNQNKMANIMGLKPHIYVTMERGSGEIPVGMRRFINDAITAHIARMIEFRDEMNEKIGDVPEPEGRFNLWDFSRIDGPGEMELANLSSDQVEAERIRALAERGKKLHPIRIMQVKDKRKEAAKALPKRFTDEPEAGFYEDDFPGAKPFTGHYS